MVTNYEGVLDCGKRFCIQKGQKKVADLKKGDQFIAVILKDDGTLDETPIYELSEKVFFELLAKAHSFAGYFSNGLGNYRIAYDGGAFGDTKYAHVHIMFPKDNDQLPTFMNQVQHQD